MIVGPIFVREALTAPRQVRHYLARSAYGLTLVVLMWTAWQAMVGFQRIESVGDIALFGGVLFKLFSFIQLGLALFFAPIVACSSIASEKERRTFELLLMTDLTNREIVLGKLLGSLLQMSVLLAAALPVFALCLLFGGASADQIGRVFAVTAATALAGGALGILIASWRDKSFQALALTILILVLYLVLVEAACWSMDQTKLLGLTGEVWGTMLSPFRSVLAVMDPVQHSPDAWLAFVLGQVLPAGFVHELCRIEWAFVAAMLLLTGLLAVMATVTLRIWNLASDRPSGPRELDEALERQQAAQTTKEANSESRPVWDNPILWREIRTRAYGHRPLIVAVYSLAFVLICLASHLASWNNPQIGLAKASVLVAVISLILINFQAVSAITSERDSRALDLLLASDITPKEFIFGKLFGVFYNTKEMIILPIGLCVYLLLAGAFDFEVWLYVVVGLLVLIAFASTLGLHAALAYDKTRSAILNSLGTIVFLFIGILVCIFLMLHSGQFGSQVTSFVVFICAGTVGMYVSLAGRNPSTALAWVSFLCPSMTWYAIAHTLRADSDPLGSFLTISLSYGFAVLAMLVPAISEFDVALGRTVSADV